MCAQLLLRIPEAGWHQNVVGKTNCKVCGVRKFQPNDSKEWCVNCPAGWKTLRGGSFHREPNEDGPIANGCGPCPHHWFDHDVKSNSDCIFCGSGYTTHYADNKITNTAATLCKACVAGRYDHDDDPFSSPTSSPTCGPSSSWTSSNCGCNACPDGPSTFCGPPDLQTNALRCTATAVRQASHCRSVAPRSPP